MRAYRLIKASSLLSEKDLTDLINKQASQGWILDKFNVTGVSDIFEQKIYMVFYKEEQ